MPRPTVPFDVMSHGKRTPLRALTSLRFFAASYIIVMHTDIPSLDRLPWALAHFLRSGYTAVTLFFALSGFILAYNYPHVASCRVFWVSRFARIYPAYLLALVAWVVLSISNADFRHNSLLPPALVASIFLVQAWLPAIATMVNPMGWTLSVEAFFYAVFPFLNPICRGVTRTGATIFSAFAVLLAASPVFLAPFHRNLALYLANRMDNTVPIFRLCTFLIGVLAGTMFNRAHRRIRGLLTLSIASTLALLCWAPRDLGDPLKTMLLSFTYAGCIYALATVESGFLTSRWLLLGGEISYSMYILQFVVFRIVHKLAPPFLRDQRILVDLLLPLTLILVSWCSFRFLEVPARLRLRSLLLPKRLPAPPEI